MALTDFWELKDNMDAGARKFLNVYHCKRILAGANAQDVADAFLFSILTLNYRGMQHTSIARTNVEVQNLGDPTDFAIVPSSAFGGTDTGDHIPYLVAASIQFNRTRTDMKHGQKRLAVGAETDMLQGAWDLSFQAQLDLIGDTLVDTWKTAAAPLVDVCSYAVLKRFCVVGGQEPCLKYRLPNSDTEVDGFHYVPLTFTRRDTARSQVSRKLL